MDCPHEGVSWEQDGEPLRFQVPHVDLIARLEVHDTSGVTGVRLGVGLVAGVSHGRAEQEGVLVGVDLEGVHVVIVQVIDLDRENDLQSS